MIAKLLMLCCACAVASAAPGIYGGYGYAAPAYAASAYTAPALAHTIAAPAYAPAITHSIAAPAYAPAIAHSIAAPAYAPALAHTIAAPAYAPALAHTIAAPAYAPAIAHSIAAPAYAPVVKAISAPVIRAEPVDPNPAYSFSYGVADPSTGDHKDASETLQNGVVQGSYSLVEPDGHVRKVTYTADKINGFNAVVERTGGAAAAPIAVASPIAKVIAAPAPISYAAPAPITYAAAAPISYAAPVAKLLAPAPVAVAAPVAKYTLPAYGNPWG